MRNSSVQSLTRPTFQCPRTRKPSDLRFHGYKPTTFSGLSGELKQSLHTLRRYLIPGVPLHRPEGHLHPSLRTPVDLVTLPSFMIPGRRKVRRTHRNTPMDSDSPTILRRLRDYSQGERDLSDVTPSSPLVQTSFVPSVPFFKFIYFHLSVGPLPPLIRKIQREHKVTFIKSVKCLVPVSQKSWDVRSPF